MADHQPEIAALIAQWQTRLREARERSRSESAGSVQTAYYYRGVSETYQQVITDLLALLEAETSASVPAAADYLPISEAQVRELLARAGLHPRSLHAHPDHAFTAVFSRLQPVSQEQRLRSLSEADARIVILDHGKLSDSNEPFIDFAFIDRS